MLQCAETLYGLCAAEDASEGQGLVEYGLIVAFVAVIVVLVVFRGLIVAFFSRIGNSLSGS